MNVTYVMLATQCWLIYEVLMLKQQIRLRFGRVESEIESEKETRKRRNATFDSRLRNLETKND